MRSLGAGAACAALLVLATIAARHASPAEVSPVVPKGNWNAVWIASVAAAFAAYAIGVAIAWRMRPVLNAAVVLAIIVQCAPLAAPLLLSKDAYLYWAEARLVTVHHASPYRKTPADFPSDPATPRTSEEWRGQPAPYGPTWEVLALAPAAAVGASARHAVKGYKLLSVLGVLVTLGIVAFATRNAAAVALLGWNPLLALHFAGGGHNDGWLVALLCLGVIARQRARGGAAWALASAFKPVGLILLPLDLAASRLRRSGRFWIALVATGAAVLVSSRTVWGTGWIRSSLVGVHGASPLGGVHLLVAAGLRHRYAVAIGGVAFAVVYGALLVSAWRNGRARLSLAASALCLTTSL